MTLKLVSNTDVRKKLADLEGQDINDFSEWSIRERVLERARNGKTQTGIKFPWAKTHDLMRLRPGEVSVWAGFSGHNKSTLLSQIAVWAARETCVGIASFEMELEDTANLMACQSAGTASPDIRWVNDFCSWSQGRIYVYDRLDSIPPEQLLSGVDHMAETLECGLIIIDSLMMVSGVVDDMERERAFLQTLTALAKHHKTHIALAHHMRKPQHGNESYIPNKFDLRGSGGIADLAHSIFICWHNKARKELEFKIQGNIPMTPEEMAAWERQQDRPDQLLIVAKQRHGSFEGGTGLWMHPSRQFTATSRRQAECLEIPRLEAAVR